MGKNNTLYIWIGLLGTFVLLNFVFLFLISNESKTYALMEKEMVILNQNRKIIDASVEISAKYKNQIKAISAVFPSEATFPDFIGAIESELQGTINEYQFKLSSDPIIEGDKLFLLMNISLKADVPNLLIFFDRLEHMPYMTHITGITAKTPGGFSSNGVYIIGMKVYVQNPFRTK